MRSIGQVYAKRQEVVHDVPALQIDVKDDQWTAEYERRARMKFSNGDLRSPRVYRVSQHALAEAVQFADRTHDAFQELSREIHRVLRAERKRRS